MTKEYDARQHLDLLDDRRRAVLREAAEAASAELPGRERARVVSFDARTGNAAVVVTDDPEPRDGDYVRRALEHVQRLGRALGLAAGQPAEFAPDPSVQEGSAGSVAVHLQQQYKGIPVYEATETVRFDPEGRLTEVAGRSHTVGVDVPVAPALSARDALVRAAEHVAATEVEPPFDPFGQPLADPPVDLSAFAPEPLVASPSRPDVPVTFTAPPFDGPVEVSLLWFPLGLELRLAWHLVLQIPGGGSYRVVVDAGDGRLLLCRQLRRSITGRATVFLRDGGQPSETVDLPLPLERYGLPIPDDLPSGFPDDWLLDASTDGTNVRASLPDGIVARGRSQAGAVVFDPGTDPQADTALVVNLFVLNGLMHDVLYLLGFRERDGNFQRGNSRGGRGTDAVRAVVHPGAVWGTANMATPPDGRPPEMNMGLVTSTGRHTALDGDVVIHEYTHGLSNRLVGGPLDTSALDGDQSGGMGEGWGDYFACLLGGRQTVGSWVVGRPGGIRLHPYTEAYPASFGHVGTEPYTGVHAIGEIWCATLLALNRRIGAALGAQLVVDGMKLSVANPSLLAMRDAILVAARDHATSRGLSAVDRDELIHRIWEAFARFGMGPGARTNGDTLRGIVADHTVPPRPQAEPATTVTASAAPELAIPDNDPTGVLSAIELAADGTIVDVSVSVDISHPYRGDLVLRVGAPDGTTAVLTDRGGGSADDLKATFTAGEHPELAMLVGGRAGGRWTLHVADRALRDVGVFHGWTLAVGVGPARPGATVTVEPGATVPDDDPEGVTSEAPIAVTGAVGELELEVDVTHTHVGDLVVTLTSPDGASATVHDRGGGGADNLRTTYRSRDGGPLADLIGETATGTWRLTVADLAGADVGKLSRWRLTVST